MTTEEEMSLRRDLAEDVLTHPDWQPVERETCVRFSADERTTYYVQSFQRAIVSDTLKHSKAQIERVHLLSGERLSRVDSVAAAASRDYDRVVGVEATLPLGTLSIKGTERADSKPSTVVSTPADVEQVREAFAETEDEDT